MYVDLDLPYCRARRKEAHKEAALMKQKLQIMLTGLLKIQILVL